MWTYETSSTWDGAKGCTTVSPDTPGIAVQPPPEFGGDAGVWTPEDLLAGSIGSCLIMTALFFVKKQNVALKNFVIKSTAKMEKGASGLEFTSVDVLVTAVVGSADDVAKLEKIVKMSENHCPVSRAVKCPVSLSVECSVG